MMSSLGTSSPWRRDSTVESRNSGRLREGMISEVPGKLGIREESIVCFVMILFKFETTT
jgi:hypothetical protein